LPSCGFFSQYRIGEAPPSDSREAVEWWDRTASQLPYETLDTYIRAAEVHFKKGTSAVYVEERPASGVLGFPVAELRLPCPPPPEVLERLRSLSIETQPPGIYHPFHATDCRGREEEEANKIWNDAREAGKKDNAAALQLLEPLTKELNTRTCWGYKAFNYGQSVESSGPIYGTPFP
jgi:hypothetical protein